MTDYTEFPQLDVSFENLTVSESFLYDITYNLQIILHTMVHDSDVNLTRYRTDISHPTPEKEIATFTDQMQRVSLQVII